MGGAAPHLPSHIGERLRLAMAARVSRCAARAERALSTARDPAQQQENPQCRGRARRDRARHTQTRCRCCSRRTLEALYDDHAARRARYSRHIGKVAAPSDPPFEEQALTKKQKGNLTMSITRR